MSRQGAKRHRQCADAPSRVSLSPTKSSPKAFSSLSRPHFARGALGHVGRAGAFFVSVHPYTYSCIRNRCPSAPIPSDIIVGFCVLSHSR
eukprot:scaffold14596_cov112-Isochrysis_galbana.AAC.3